MQDLATLTENLDNSKLLMKTEKGKKRPSAQRIAFLQQQIVKYTYTLKRFGQRYDIACVKVTYQGEGNITKSSYIYLTDVSAMDAEKWVRSIMEVAYKIIEISAFPIKAGEPIKMV